MNSLIVLTELIFPQDSSICVATRLPYWVDPLPWFLIKEMTLISISQSSKFSGKLFTFGFVNSHILYWLLDCLLGNIAECQRFRINSESSSSLSVKNILQPFFQVLLSEGWLHDWEDSSLRVDQQHSGEAGIEWKLILEFWMVASLCPKETDGFISEIVNGLYEKTVTPFTISR